MAKAWLLDPFVKTATPIVVDKLEDYYAAIGCKLIEAVDVMREDNPHTLYVDEEGLIGDKPPTHFVVPFEVDIPNKKVTGVGQPLAGRAVLVGFNPETGESIDAALPTNWMLHMFGAATLEKSTDDDDVTGVMNVTPFTIEDKHQTT